MGNWLCPPEEHIRDYNDSKHSKLNNFKKLDKFKRSAFKDYHRTRTQNENIKINSPVNNINTLS